MGTTLQTTTLIETGAEPVVEPVAEPVAEPKDKKQKRETTSSDEKGKYSSITNGKPVKSISIQELKRVDRLNYTISTTAEKVDKAWLQKKCNHWDGKCKCSILSYYENIPVNVSHSNYLNPFYGAFLQAYNHHQDVVLSPDDVMMCIGFSFSKYVNANAEKMRKLFVSHEGKKFLQVTTWNETSESQWDEFFQLMIKAIAENTKGEIVDTLQCKFSTTTLVEQALSTACIMDTLKQYFKYGRCIPCCGIRNVHFMGEKDDWELLITKIKKLQSYAIDASWKSYIEGVLSILDEFLKTYNGKPNKDFWNKIMNITHGSLGSGSTSYVSGWILNFFYGLGGRKVETCDIPSFSMDFPIEIDNKLTGVKKTVYLIGGFGGLAYANEAFRPQQSMIICEGVPEKTKSDEEDF